MFVATYALMYAMVDRFANVYSNLNQVYMAGLMTAPMVLIELAVMRSMIPHHAGAILMCEEAPIASPEIRKLCTEIIEGQRREIAQMKALLERTP